jgi:hypothetical protein
MERKQEQRLALNEALFRDVNERIREISDTFGQKDSSYDFLCECSDPACAERVVLTSAEYEFVRADSTRFVVAKGHATPEIESVVDQAKDHVVVEKEGAAAEVAVHLDQ